MLQLLNRSRLRTATSYLYAVYSYDVPSRLASARQNCIEAIWILADLTPVDKDKTVDEAEAEMENNNNLRVDQRETGPETDVDVELADEVEQPKLTDIFRMLASRWQIWSWASTLLRLMARTRGRVHDLDLEMAEQDAGVVPLQEQRPEDEEATKLVTASEQNQDKEEAEISLVAVLPPGQGDVANANENPPDSASTNVQIACVTSTSEDETCDDVRAALASSFSRINSASTAVDENHFHVHKFGLSNLQSWRSTDNGEATVLDSPQEEDHQVGPPVVNFSEPLFMSANIAGGGSNEIGDHHAHNHYHDLMRQSNLDIPRADAEQDLLIHPRSFSDKDLSEMMTKMDLETSSYPSNLGFSQYGVGNAHGPHAEPPRSVSNLHPHARQGSSYSLSEKYPSLRSLDLSGKPPKPPTVSSSSNYHRSSGSGSGSSRNH